MVVLCVDHLAMVDRNGEDGDPDFWRWALAMMQSPGTAERDPRPGDGVTCGARWAGRSPG
jgi:hypothetical protein